MFVLGSVLVAVSLSVSGDNTPNSIYDAMTYSKQVAKVEKGVLYQVETPESASLKVIHVFGNATERGYAYGQLLAKQILHFLEKGDDAKISRFFSFSG